MGKRTPFLLLLLLLFLFSSYIFSQERGFRVVAKTEEGEVINLYKGCYALVIGISDYQFGWPDLPNAAVDAEEIGNLLESIGFEVTRIKDANRDEIDKELNSFIFGPGHEKDNCLVIFFAGHGWTERLAYGDDMGYIVPRDAPSPSLDNAGFKEKAIDMRTIDTLARKIEAKHALFLFDSCFSGAIFDMTRAVPPKYISFKTEKPVRQFITAGGADETVPDRSHFKGQLIEALQGEADRNKDGYVTGTELGEFLQEKVVSYSYGAQHPQYGKIRDPNLDKGDFVFHLEREAKEKPIKQEKPKLEDLGFGYLVISSHPPTKVEIDGKLYREVPPQLEIKLLEGKHTIRFYLKELNIDKTIEIVLTKGERRKIHEIFDQRKKSE